MIRRLQKEAPGVQLRFIRKLDKDSQGWRDGSTDLETGVVDEAISPEIRSRALFTDCYIGSVRSGHPLAHAAVTAADYASWPHVISWRPGLDLGQVDQLLEELGLARKVVSNVDGLSIALALARGSDLVATVPCLHTTGLRRGYTVSRFR